MKGIENDLGDMKIPLKLETRAIKKIPYRPNPMYKKKVKEKIDRMLEASIIEPVITL
jgi:hypothetical protein